MIYKFNSGRGAVLCSYCGVILYEGNTIPQSVKEAIKSGKKFSDLADFYCSTCEKKLKKEK